MVSKFDVPYRDARHYLASGAPVYLGVNSVECHGPHVPLHNDRLISAGIARDMHQAIGAGRLAGELAFAANGLGWSRLRSRQDVFAPGQKEQRVNASSSP